MKKLCLFLSVLFLLNFCACINSSGGSTVNIPEYAEDNRNLTEHQYTVYNTVATDDFGRVTYAVDSVKTDKQRDVGMFYFMTLGSANNISGIFDVSKIIEEYGIEEFGKDSVNSPAEKAHIWGEPVFGYYDSRDPWVIRRQIEMLTFAGVDYICVDGTNGLLYFYVADIVLETLKEYHNKGWDVPKFCYYLGGPDPTDGQPVYYFDLISLKDVYEQYYVDGKYDDVMYKVDGKPFVVIREATENYLKSSSDDYLNMLGNYFSFRHRQWPNDSDVYHENALPWMDWEYPQKIHNGAINVSIAQHVTSRFSDTVGSRGRGWNFETGENEHDKFVQNLNYENQWKTSLSNDSVNNVFLTGWNEWTATKQTAGCSENNGYSMCDQFNDEFSRDIEPTKTGGLKDNAYLQTIRNIRDFKYIPAAKYSLPIKSFGLSDFDENLWKGTKTFRDFTGDAIPRSFQRYDGGAMYEDFSNRNDIDKIQVARDNDNLYFRIQTVENITSYRKGDTRWMNLRINTHKSSNKDSMGYEFIVNSKISEEGKSVVQKADKNGKYNDCGTAEYAVNGNVMLVKIPLSSLGLNAADCEIEFKVTDNVKTTDVLEYYVSGDSAPIGRLNYRFGY